MTYMSDLIDKPLVEIRGLHFKRGEQVIFDGVDIDIPRGKVTAIMGPSGTGKTTLLRLIGGQLRPDAGTILVDGQEVAALSTRALYQLRKRMGMLFQSGALLTDINVYDNVAFPLREHTELPEPMIRSLVLMKLEAVGLRVDSKQQILRRPGGMAWPVLAAALLLASSLLAPGAVAWGAAVAEILTNEAGLQLCTLTLIVQVVLAGMLCVHFHVKISNSRTVHLQHDVTSQNLCAPSYLK